MSNLVYKVLVPVTEACNQIRPQIVHHTQNGTSLCPVYLKMFEVARLFFREAKLSVEFDYQEMSNQLFSGSVLPNGTATGILRLIQSGAYFTAAVEYTFLDSRLKLFVPSYPTGITSAFFIQARKKAELSNIFLPIHVSVWASILASLLAIALAYVFIDWSKNESGRATLPLRCFNALYIMVGTLLCQDITPRLQFSWSRKFLLLSIGVLYLTCFNVYTGSLLVTLLIEPKQDPISSASVLAQKIEQGKVRAISTEKWSFYEVTEAGGTEKRLKEALQGHPPIITMATEQDLTERLKTETDLVYINWNPPYFDYCSFNVARDKTHASIKSGFLFAPNNGQNETINLFSEWIQRNYLIVRLVGERRRPLRVCKASGIPENEPLAFSNLVQAFYFVLAELVIGLAALIAEKTYKKFDGEKRDFSQVFVACAVCAGIESLGTMPLESFRASTLTPVVVFDDDERQSEVSLLEFKCLKCRELRNYRLETLEAEN